MESFKITTLLVLIALLGTNASPFLKNGPIVRPENPVEDVLGDYIQKWGYVEVREGAQSFWWLFQAQHDLAFQTRPLIMWLQGGPGASSTGIGNFELIGPVDSRLQPRPYSWIQEANLLFVDNPIGTGYSWAENDDAFAPDTELIANDLLSLLIEVYKQAPEYKSCPFYIFGESYGGKMAAVFARTLHKAIRNGEIEMDFRGFAMGNAWISPEDSTLTWAPLLHWMSVLDQPRYELVQNQAKKVSEAIKEGKWFLATQRWRQTQVAILQNAANIDFYNILNYNTPEDSQMIMERLGDDDHWHEHLIDVPYIDMNNLDSLMNGHVKQYLGVPDDVIWGYQSSKVFQTCQTDFMKPVVSVIDELLNTTDLEVIVYQGQLDLICDNKGAMDWVQKFTWPGLKEYNAAKRVVIRDPDSNQPETFAKAHGKFKFYWNLEAGHTVPADQGFPALRMLRRIIDDVDH